MCNTKFVGTSMIYFTTAVHTRVPFCRLPRHKTAMKVVYLFAYVTSLQDPLYCGSHVTSSSDRHGITYCRKLKGASMGGEGGGL